MPLVGKTMAEGHTHRMAVLCEKLGSTLREILDGTCPQPAKPEKAPKRPALEKYRETYLIPPKIKGPKAVFISEETRSDRPETGLPGNERIRAAGESGKTAS